MPINGKKYLKTYFGSALVIFYVLFVIHFVIRLAYTIYFLYHPVQIPLKYSFIGLCYDVFSSFVLSLLLAVFYFLLNKLFSKVLLISFAFLLLLLSAANMGYFEFYKAQLSLSLLLQVGDVLLMPSLAEAAYVLLPFLLVVFILFVFLALKYLRQTLNKKVYLHFFAITIVSFILLGFANSNRFYGYKKHPLQSNLSLLFLKEASRSITKISKKPKTKFLKKILFGSRDFSKNPMWLTSTVTAENKKINILKKKIPKNFKPNIILLTLESFNASESAEYYPGKKSRMPFVDSILKQSLIVKNFYANGYQTVRGNVAIECSHLPSFQYGRIYSDYTFNDMNCMAAILEKKGYSKFWLSGFYKEFHNKEEFLTNHGYKKNELYGIRSFPKDTPKTGDGIADVELYKKFVKLIDKQEEPFFASSMSYSTHFPFDLPQGYKSKYPKEHRLFQTFRYSDKALKLFFKLASSRKWFKNTLFILVGDHTVMVPYWRRYNKAKLAQMANRVIFGFYFPKYLKAYRIDTIASQVDILPTLMDILGWDQEIAAFGSSFLNKDINKKRLSPFFYVKSIGYHRPNYFYYHFQGKDIYLNTEDMIWEELQAKDIQKNFNTKQIPKFLNWVLEKNKMK